MTFKRFACAVLRCRLTYRAARDEIAAFTGRRNATQMAADIVPGPVVGRIEARLERMDMPLEAALEAAELPRDFLDKLWLGKTSIPRGKRLLKPAEALGTSVSYLVGLNPEVAPPQELLEEDQASFDMLAGDEEALLRAYRRLDIPSRVAALHMLFKMAGPEPVSERKKAPRSGNA